MQKNKAVGISLPHNILEKIDRDRLDVPRSRFVLRLLENSYSEQWNKNDSLDSGLKALSSSESLGGS